MGVVSSSAALANVALKVKTRRKVALMVQLVILKVLFESISFVFTPKAGVAHEKAYAFVFTQ